MIIHNLVIYLVVFIFFFSFSGLRSDSLREANIKSAFLCVDNKDCLLLEIVDTPKGREYGLMGREYLDKNKGMLFLYEEPAFVKMWMLNTYIKLDMIFIRNNKIISIMKNIEPCINMPCQSYGPETLVDSVIEVNSGIANEKNLSIGQEINLIYSHKN